MLLGEIWVGLDVDMVVVVLFGVLLGLVKFGVVGVFGVLGVKDC